MENEESELIHKKIIRERTLQEINLERERQDRLFGNENRKHSDLKWLAIATEELGEIAQGINDSKSDIAIEEEIIQVAAVCVAWLDQRRGRF